MAEVDGVSPGGSSAALDGDKRPDRDEQESPVSGPSSLKKIVEVACWPCRKRKSKCSGERPSCSGCTRKGSECTYEHEEGLTRLGSLRYKLSEATVQAETLQYLFDQLRSRSDNEAACLLALLRMGVDVEVLVTQLKTSPDDLFKMSPNSSRLLPQLRQQIESASKPRGS